MQAASNTNSNPPVNGIITDETDPQLVLNDIITLIENDIPECRKTLRDNHLNLQRVAEYCDTNYSIATNRQAALEETKSYATQSLAYAAYQITTLAFHVLRLLDLQTSQMTELESQTNHISQYVDIYKEKVARREIGLFTATKRVNRPHKILVPANPERPIKYVRKPIDYSLLDDVGHGVKLSATNQQQLQQNQMHTSRTRSISSAQSINGANSLYGPTISVSGMSNSSIQPPTTRPPTPPQTIRSVGSLSRASKEYRNPALSIAPPQVPSNYAPNYPIGHPRNAETARRESGYSTLPLNHHTNIANQNAQQSHYSQQPQIGMVHPLSHANNSARNSTSEAPLPPPPMPPSPIPVAGDPLEDHQRASMLSNMPTGFNIYNRNSDTLRYGQSPMPPPPNFEESNPSLNGNHHNNNYSHGTIHKQNNNNEPDWVPKNYIEKVIALYDYTKDKSDELTFCENSVIYVIKKNEDGWYEGVLDGETGLFPCNYVEPCRDYPSS